MKRIGLAIIHTRGHPRTCEEYPCVHLSTQLRGVIPVNSGNTWFLKRTKICQGSSPHVRGIPLRPLAHSDATEPPPRIAGNAPFTIQEEPTPPMRGTHHFSTVGAAIVRRTPAYAGSTDHRAIRDAGQRYHPRVCGEHTAVLTRVPPEYGSPPRMRGTHAAVTDARRVGGSPPHMRGTLCDYV